jgi:hypothetical protein
MSKILLTIPVVLMLVISGFSEAAVFTDKKIDINAVENCSGGELMDFGITINT